MAQAVKDKCEWVYDEGLASGIVSWNAAMWKV